MIVRAATRADVPAMAALYAHHTLTGTGTFDEVPPGEEAMAGKLHEVRGLDLPFLVAEADGLFAGYAYASPFRMRRGYRFTVEDSVYVADEAQGRGVGRGLLEALAVACEARGLRQMLAVIGDSDNAASIRLHEACGFSHVGTMRAVGFKHQRWLDVIVMQRALNGGDATAPELGA